MNAYCLDGAPSKKLFTPNLEVWQRYFGKAGVKVVATEELEREPKATVDGVVDFLGLPPFDFEPSALSRRLCVTSKAGVMDVNPAAKNVAGALSAPTGGVGIGSCRESGKARGRDGLLRNEIGRDTERLLSRFFAPFNKRVYALAGRSLGWAPARPG